MDELSLISVTVVAVVSETAQVKSFYLERTDGKLLPPFAGGAHVETHLPHDGEVLIRRFSLSGNPLDRARYRLTIRRRDVAESATQIWHNHVVAGTKLFISPPVNYFRVEGRARHHVFCAAGIGITPFLSMLCDAMANGVSVELHYSAKTREDCAFAKELAACYGDKVKFYFTRETGNGRFDAASLGVRPVGTHVYACGPGTFISDVREALKTLGYPESHVHFERFTADKATPKRPFEVFVLQSPEISALAIKDDPVVVAGEESGVQVHVGEDTSMLEALLHAGFPVRSSCRSGGCGTCLVEVVEGEVCHEDFYLTDEERETGNVMLPCVSRAKGQRLSIRLFE